MGSPREMNGFLIKGFELHRNITTLNIVSSATDSICLVQYYFLIVHVVSPMLNVDLTLFVIPCENIWAL